MQMTLYSIYIHIPFCTHRCGYCDFNTYAGLEALIPDYVSALCAEILCAATSAPEQLPIHTIFFGGGTPSLLPVPELERIFAVLQASFNLTPSAEITIEANPGTLSPAYLQELRRLGVTRLSLGIQSANPAELRLLERQHSYADVIQSVNWARQAGFDNLNLDLIFGLPEQPIENWQRSLELALGLRPEHLSLYALTVEQDTPFGHWVRRGLLCEPDPDRAAEMYEWASHRLEQSGYTQYEISNWACSTPSDSLTPLLACRHNLQYWRNLPYLGFGAGAHGYAAGIRTANILSPTTYIQKLATANSKQFASPHLQPAVISRHPKFAIRNPKSEIPPFPHTPATLSTQAIDRKNEIAETMMLGLRLTQEGISGPTFQQRFGQSLGEVFNPQIDRLRRLGLLEWAGEEGQILRLSKAGRLLGNQVFMEFV
jgi:oxygen-independent coproporphyrinogen-3 oxidase